MADVIHDEEARDTLRDCPTGTKIQTLVFDRDMFTTSQAASWARRHGFQAPTADVKLNTIRIRQENPEKFQAGSLRTIRLRAGVQAVIGCPKLHAGEEAKEAAAVVHEPEVEREGLHPYAYSTKGALQSERMILTPQAGGWHVTDSGEYMGFVKKLKKGWKIDAAGKDTSGRHFQACKKATELLDAYRQGDRDRFEAEFASAQRQTKEGGEDHVHAVPAGTTGPEIPIAKDEPAKTCGCTPTVSIVRDEKYNHCLAEAAKLGPIKNTSVVYELVRQHVETQNQEVLLVVPLDARNQLIGGVVEVHKGASASVQVSTMHVLQAVTTTGATQYCLVHNHPSGKATPSRADLHLTKHLERATKQTFGDEVLLLDHVIIGRKQFYSIREEKLYTVK